MNKRRVRVNILDIMIFTVIICVVAVIGFRDTITEFFGKPEIITLRYTVSAPAVERGTYVLFYEGDEVSVAVGDIAGQATLTRKKAFYSQVDGCYDMTMVITGLGYRRFGKFYTSEGLRLTEGESYIVSCGNVSCTAYFAGVEAYVPEEEQASIPSEPNGE